VTCSGVSRAPHVFSDEYYDRLADIEEYHWWSAGVRTIQRRLLDRVAAEHGIQTALDAGCGTGLTLTWLKRYTREPIGIDRALAALRFCVGRGHARLLQADGTELPFASGGFDLVLSCDVIQHLPRPRGDARALAEMARVLIPGGHLLLGTNSRCGYPEGGDSPDYHRYTLAELERKLADADLVPMRLSYVNFPPAVALTA